MSRDVSRIIKISNDFLKALKEFPQEAFNKLPKEKIDECFNLLKILDLCGSDAKLADEFKRVIDSLREENMSEEKETVVTKLRQVEELEKMEAETVEEVKEVKKISKQELDQILEAQKSVREKSDLFERASVAARIAELELENAQSKSLNVIQGTFLRNGISPDMQIDNNTGEVITQEEGEARRVAKENAEKAAK